MSRNSWIWLDMAGNCWKLLELLETAEYCRKWLEWLEIAGNDYNGCKGMAMDGNSWNGMDRVSKSCNHAIIGLRNTFENLRIFLTNQRKTGKIAITSCLMCFKYFLCNF